MVPSSSARLSCAALQSVQHGDHEPPPLRLAVVIGADLPRHTQRIPACRGRLLQKLQRREHRQRVRRAGQALDLERESIKPAAVVFMGIARSTGEISGQDDLLDDMFHSPTALYSYGRVYSPAGAIMKWNMVIKTACRDRGKPRCFFIFFCGACPSWTRPQDGIPACAPQTHGQRQSPGGRSAPSGTAAQPRAPPPGPSRAARGR